MVLYSNNYYLQKYNITIPKTWNELINITEYVLEEEHKLNNYNIIGYNGLFPGNFINMKTLLLLLSFSLPIFIIYIEFNSNNILILFR